MKITALQMVAKAGDVDANLARIERAVAEAAGKGARLLVAPELAVTGYGAADAFATLAEASHGAAASRLAALAARHGVAIVAGFAETADGRVWNSALFVDPSGRRIVYRKSHLYGDYERRHFAAGEPTANVFEYGGLRLGMLICYDVEFPENVRRLAQSGAQLVLVPTALPASDHAALIAQKMIPVRAFENQVFLAYVDHCGADERFAYAGLSGIAAPDGALLAKAGVREALLSAEIRPADYAVSAAANPYLADLRTA
ncbi:MAG: carbon-nitrogen hydrolase family protein [Rhizobiaceae bacterium]